MRTPLLKFFVSVYPILETDDHPPRTKQKIEGTHSALAVLQKQIEFPHPLWQKEACEQNNNTATDFLSPSLPPYLHLPPKDCMPETRT
jgi:hypothetical protein